MVEPRSDPTRALVVALVLSLLLVAMVPAATAGEAVGFVYLSTALEPSQPTTEAEFNLTTTFTNAPESSESFEIQSVELADGTGTDAESYDAVSYRLPTRHTIAPGESFSQGLTLDFDEAGTYPVYVIADLSTVGGGETFTLTRRVDVPVFDPHPGLEATARPTTAGEPTPVTVTVANGFERPIRDLDLRLTSPTVTFRENQRIGASVPGGEDRTFRFNATAASLGTHAVQARLAYSDANGTRHRVYRTLEVAFEAPELNGRVNLAADVASAIPGSETTLNLSVSNGLDRDIREFEVVIGADGTSIRQARRIGSSLESGETRTLSYVVSRDAVGEAPIDVSLSFTTVDGIDRQVNRTVSVAFTAPTNLGNVTVTGLSFERSADDLRVSGSASNVGGTTVEGVVIAVGSSDAVRPGATEAEFFVGTVAASDFVSFDVTARLLDAATPVTVPLEVSYTVEGVRRTRTVELTYAGGEATTPAPRPGGPPPLTLAAGLLVAVVIAVLGVWGWRRGRD